MRIAELIEHRLDWLLVVGVLRERGRDDESAVNVDGRLAVVG